MERLDEVPEACLQQGEDRSVDHHHGDIAATGDSLTEHLTTRHGVDIPQGLSLGTLQGMHDRFHHEAHAVDD